MDKDGKNNCIKDTGGLYDVAAINTYVKHIKVNNWMIIQQMDFKKYYTMPTSHYLQNRGTFVLNPTLMQTCSVFIRRNKVEARDHLILIGLPGDEYEYWDVYDTT